MSHDEAVVDWTGTSRQVKAAINAPGPFIVAGDGQRRSRATTRPAEDGR